MTPEEAMRGNIEDLRMAVRYGNVDSSIDASMAIALANILELLLNDAIRKRAKE